MLIDLENVVGFRPKRRTLRTRMTALLEAAGPRHHAVAAYASLEDTDDVTASTLAALGVAPLRVTPAPDAAELALLAHARRMQADGCASFTVCSGDHAFAVLGDADALTLDVLVWQGQPVATGLAAVADHVRRLPRLVEGDVPVRHKATGNSGHRTQHRTPSRSTRQTQVPSNGLVTGFATGIGIALGARLGSVLWPGANRRGAPRTALAPGDE
ncbi:hypothetical protein [Amycolatopsis sp. PS_44_ISF1]|uniref:hypothetical protein n=1 Tax=Amycolatopsis sp. PS_44_ISF1 TaxID=2974917 RepID=UPI0028DEB9B5|nr:hypothetical protein [Amycolatopsis sp. PS_44_ISF1]MDT8913738.1 hypothetical protein [Amycolatopsis sp. PS_44_ISF1]